MHSTEEAKRLEPSFGSLYLVPDWTAVANGLWD